MLIRLENMRSTPIDGAFRLIAILCVAENKQKIVLTMEKDDKSLARTGFSIYFCNPL